MYVCVCVCVVLVEILSGSSLARSLQSTLARWVMLHTWVHVCHVCSNMIYIYGNMTLLIWKLALSCDYSSVPGIFGNPLVPSLWC